MPRLLAALVVLLLPACAHPTADTSKPADPPVAADTPAAVDNPIAADTPVTAAPLPSADPPIPVDAPRAAEEPPANAGFPPATATRQIQITDKCPGRPVRVFTAAVDGNDLLVKFGTPGCQAPEIWACSDGKLMESLPPKLRIEIRRSDSGTCEKLHTFRERFDLSAILGDAGYESVSIEVSGKFGDKTVEWKR
jgi:hypothetical protein